jgi:hypothetical protein
MPATIQGLDLHQVRLGRLQPRFSVMINPYHLTPARNDR